MYAYHLTQVQACLSPVDRDYSIFRSVVLTVTPIKGGRLASGFIPGFRLCRFFYSKAQSGEDDEEDEEM